MIMKDGDQRTSFARNYKQRYLDAKTSEVSDSDENLSTMNLDQTMFKFKSDESGLQVALSA